MIDLAPRWILTSDGRQMEVYFVDFARLSVQQRGALIMGFMQANNWTMEQVREQILIGLPVLASDCTPIA